MASTSEAVPEPSPPRQALIGASLALFAAIGFSGKAILVKLAYQDGVDAVTLLALRMVLSVPLFLAAAVWSGRRGDLRPLERRDWAVIVGLGLLGYYLSSLLDFCGLETISAGLERLILFLYPTMVMLLSVLLFKRPVGRRELAALALSYGGIALVLRHDLGTVQAGVAVGALFVFASTLTYSAYLIGVGRVVAHIGTIRFTACAMLVASAASLAQFVLTHSPAAIRQPLRVYELGAAMAVFSTVLPVFMLSAAIRVIGPDRTSLIGSVGPVSTIFLAWAFLGEAVSMLQIGGSALVLAGVLAVTAGKGR